jgi:hypothetical protein
MYKPLCRPYLSRDQYRIGEGSIILRRIKVRGAWNLCLVWDVLARSMSKANLNNPAVVTSVPAQ